MASRRRSTRRRRWWWRRAAPTRPESANAAQQRLELVVRPLFRPLRGQSRQISDDLEHEPVRQLAAADVVFADQHLRELQVDLGQFFDQALGVMDELCFLRAI